MRSRAFAVSMHILNPYQHAMRHFARRWRAPVTSHITDDYRAPIAGVHLRTMVLANLHALLETKRFAQPRNGLAYVGINQDGHDSRCRN